MAMRGHRAARAVFVALASFALVGGLLAVLVRQPGVSTTDLRATPGTAWLSGESQGQVVLAAAGGELASVSVSVANAADQLDVVDLGQSVFVHNRTVGELVRLAGVNGELKERLPAPRAEGGPTDLVRAGNNAYLVDQAKKSAQRINDDGTRLEAKAMGEFTSWVGDDEGKLWLVDNTSGNVSSFDGTDQRTSRIVQLGADNALTSVGGDPVLVDRTNNRLRWLRRGITFEPAVSMANALVQQPSLRGSCLQIVADGQLRCFSPKRQERGLVMTAATEPNQQLFANERNVLITNTNNSGVLVGSWRTKTWVQTDRPTPSKRTPIAWGNPGPLLVDDPGSRYAVTADDARLVVLDKFSRLTLVNNEGQDPNGVTIGASGPVDPAQTEVLATQIERAQAKALGGPNLPPVAQPDRVITRSGRTVQIAPLANDTDPNGDILAILDAGPIPDQQGKVLVSGGQILNFTPPDRFVGQITFPYTITDPGNLNSASTVTVDVIGGDRNTPPRVSDDASKTPVNVGVTIDVLANDRDDEGDPLTITETSTPSHGTVSLRAEGIRYEPAPGYAGADEFTYTVIDGYGGKATGTVRLTMVAPQSGNKPPLAVDDRAGTRAGRHVTIPVLLNDVDPEGEQLRVVETRDTPGLTLAIVNGETVDALPANNVTGPVSFTYTVEDTGGLRSTATVILLVEPITQNRPPEAVDDRATAASAAISIDVTGNDSDPDGDTLTIVDSTQPGQGRTTRISGTTIRFEPLAGTSGTQTFSYTISDPDGLRSTARVTVEVIAPTRSGPVARNDSATVFPGETVVVRWKNNDSHPDGLGFSLVGTPVGRGADIKVNADETMSFTPPDATLTTYTFTYTVQDTAGKTASAQIAITVIAKPVVNRPPSAKDDRADVPFGGNASIAVLSNDSDPDNDVLSLTGVGNGTGGTAVISGASVVFTATAGFSGLASFSYTIADPAGLTATAKVVVQVADRPKVAPIAVNDALISVGGARVSLDPAANDTDPDGTTAALAVRSAAAESDGVTVAVAPRMVTIQPPSTPGSYRISYVIGDADGLTATGIITVTVQSPPNQPPVAVADAVETGFGVAVSIPVLSNDSDPDGGRLTITAVSEPVPSGTATATAIGIRYVPAPNFSGTARFTYTITDPQGATSTTTVNVIVNACSAATPVLSDDAASTRLNTPVTINLFANDASPTGTFAVLAADRGSAVQSGAGQATYTPPANFSGRAQFAYTVTNACGVVATASVTVSINRPPNAKDDNARVISGQSVTVQVLANDGDPDGDPVTVVAASATAGGTTTFTGADVTFAATAGFVGDGGFTYTIRDTGGLTATASVSVKVLSANRPPVAQNDGASAVSGTTININVLSNDSDLDGDVITITGVSPVGPPGSGSATVNGGSISYTAPTGFSGLGSFSYSISDGNGGTASATVSLTVTAPVVINQPPTANFDTCGAALGAVSVTCNLLGNDPDPEGDPLQITAVSASSSDPTGILGTTWGGNSVSLLLNPLVPQVITINYTISDGRGNTANGTAQVTIS